MLGWNTNHLNNFQVATAMLKDGWTADVQRMSRSDRFVATVVHPFGNELSGGVPWPIEDPSLNAEDIDRHPNTAHPTYLTIGEAMSGAQRYVDILSKMAGYPDPHKMSARGDRPILFSIYAPGAAADRNIGTEHLMDLDVEVISPTKANNYPPTISSSNMDDAERLDKDIQILDLQTRVLELEAALEAGHIDVQFAILNRTGINQRWHRRPTDADTVIFFDLDYIHNHNERWGYSVTDDH